ncbi:MAG: MFS transporter [Dehalococcoidales bacterium]|nr:MAG: MFS transporter [Dehalococcoidales bacterium]
MKKNPQQYDGMGGGMGPGGPGGARGRFNQFINIRTFRSLKNTAFRFYWGAALCQMASMNMQMVARSYLIYDVYDSEAILGYMALCNAGPMIFLSLYGGVIADRLPKKFVMIAGQLVSAVVSLAIAFVLMSGYINADNPGSWWVLAVAAFFQGTVMGLMMPARQAMVPEIVGQEQLLNALSLNTVGMSGMRFIAPAVGGFLIFAFDYAAVYFTMTGIYLLAVFLTTFLPSVRTTRIVNLQRNSALADIREGFRYLRHQKDIIFILVFTLIAVLLSMPYMILMPVFAKDILQVGASGYGVLMSVSGIGAIIGAVTLASLPNKKRGLLLLISSLVIGCSLASFAFSTSWPLSLGLMVIVGLGTTGRMTLGNTLIQYYVEDEYRGRVMSIYMMEFGLTSFSAFIAAQVSETIGVQWVIGGLAMVLAFISLLALLFVGRIRRLD